MARGSSITQSSGAKQGAYNMNRLAVVAAAGGEPKIYGEKLDRGVAAPRFTHGRQVDSVPGGRRSLGVSGAIVPANGGDVERLLKGPGVITALEQAKDGKLAVLAGERHHVTPRSTRSKTASCAR